MNNLFYFWLTGRQNFDLFVIKSVRGPLVLEEISPGCVWVYRVPWRSFRVLNVNRAVSVRYMGLSLRHLGLPVRHLGVLLRKMRWLLLNRDETTIIGLFVKKTCVIMFLSLKLFTILFNAYFQLVTVLLVLGLVFSRLLNVCLYLIFLISDALNFLLYLIEVLFLRFETLRAITLSLFTRGN